VQLVDLEEPPSAMRFEDVYILCTLMETDLVGKGRGDVEEGVEVVEARAWRQ
jgi:hypothetical protein